MQPTDQLIPRAQLLEELCISDSSERRRRKAGGGDWPAHITIGRKVYYRRCRVEEWLAGLEAGAISADSDLSGVKQELDHAAMSPAKASTLSPPPKISLRPMFAWPNGGGSR